jgi:hypothetical protein
VHGEDVEKVEKVEPNCIFGERKLEPRKPGKKTGSFSD